jgi:DNA polymerase-3 subunit beta
MKTTLQKTLFLEKLATSSHFTSGRMGLNEALQGVLLKGDKTNLHIYSTNLSSYYHTTIPFKTDDEVQVVIDTKKIIEFLSLLSDEPIDIEFDKSQIRFIQGKTVGTFPFVNQKDFPLPPEVKDKGQTIKTAFFLKYMPLVLFSASKDESRPALNGVNFVEMDSEIGIVSTDGFRLSLLKSKKEETIGPMLIPSGFMYEMLKYMKNEGEATLFFSDTEKIVLFRVGQDEFYTRLMTASFRPLNGWCRRKRRQRHARPGRVAYEDKARFHIRARGFNIIVCDFTKPGLIMRPKTEGGKENLTQLDIET